jgi:AraC family transcriptional regulator
MGPATAEHVLARGQVFGSITRVLQLDDATLTETTYAPDARLPSHVHASPMFVLVADGSFDESFDRHERTCGPRRLVYRPPGERHAQRFLARGATCLTIELPSLANDDTLTRADGRLHLDGAPALTSMCIYDELSRPTAASSLVIEELIATLISEAARRPTLDERRPPRWLRTAREMIEASSGVSVRIADIAGAVGVHRVHLSRTFRRFFGCGVGEYVRRLRVHTACAKLRSGAHVGSTIACEAGFSDESHMGRAFRDVMHCAPGEYRRRREL